MFEVAKLMKSGGVANIKDLDMSLVKHHQSLNQQAGTCDVTLIDIFSGEGTNDVKVNKMTKPVDKKNLRFDFNSEDNFNPDADSVQIAKKAWDWLLNPLGAEYFQKEIKDKKIMII